MKHLLQLALCATLAATIISCENDSRVIIINDDPQSQDIIPVNIADLYGKWQVAQQTFIEDGNNITTVTYNNPSKQYLSFNTDNQLIISDNFYSMTQIEEHTPIQIINENNRLYAEYVEHTDTTYTWQDANDSTITQQEKYTATLTYNLDFYQLNKQNAIFKITRIEQMHDQIKNIITTYTQNDYDIITIQRIE